MRSDRPPLAIHENVRCRRQGSLLRLPGDLDHIPQLSAEPRPRWRSRRPAVKGPRGPAPGEGEADVRAWPLGEHTRPQDLHEGQPLWREPERAHLQ